MLMKAQVKVNPRVRELHTLAEPDAQAAAAGLRAIDKLHRQQSAKAFNTEGWDNTGERWHAWSKPYAKYRKQLAGLVRKTNRREKALGLRRGAMPRLVTKILHLTGDMRAAFTREGGDHIATAQQIGGKWLLRVGARSAYAVYHEEGRKPMPRRSVLDRRARQVTQLYEAAKKALWPYVQRRARVLERIAKFRAGGSRA